jgi:tetratricopeptide (TPR) repeat protein
MNQPSLSFSERLARLAGLLRQDPANTLLLTEVAEAALAAGALEEAEGYVEQGIREEGLTPHWLFRKAKLRLAQNRLGEARELLDGVRQAVPPHPGVDHDLAYIAFREGDLSQCTAILSPWIDARETADHALGAAQALWLRAKHHQDELQEAWAWIEARGVNLAPAAAGVASLIAVDLEQMTAAETLSSIALRANPDQPEALVARACVALGERDTEQAQALLSRTVESHPHQARAWSTLGYVDLLQMDPARARNHFGKALELEPRNLAALIGLGWSNLSLNDLEGAARAFEAAVDIDPEYAEGHGGLAVVAAMSGSAHRSAAEVARARQLQPGSVAARYAQAIATGNFEGLKHVQKIASLLIGQSVLQRRSGPPAK